MLACVRTFVFCQIRALACVRVAHTIGPFHTAGPTPQIIRGNGIISNVIDVGPRPTALLSRDTVLRQVVRIRGAARSATRVGLTFEAVSSTQGNAIRSVMRAGGWAGRREDSVVRSWLQRVARDLWMLHVFILKWKSPNLVQGGGKHFPTSPVRFWGQVRGQVSGRRALLCVACTTPTWDTACRGSSFFRIKVLLVHTKRRQSTTPRDLKTKFQKGAPFSLFLSRASVPCLQAGVDLWAGCVLSSTTAGAPEIALDLSHLQMPTRGF